MRKIMAVIATATILVGCSTAYRSGQTPDDVYFSPARNNAGYVVTDEEDGNGRYNASAVPMQDRYMRMKSIGGSRWNVFDDDFSYWNNPYWNNRAYFDMYSFGGFNSIGLNSLTLGNPFMFNPMSYYYSPFSPMYYGQPVVVLNTFKTTVAPRNSGPRVYNLSNYNPPRQTVGYSKFGNVNISGSSNNSNYYRSNNYNTGGSNRIFNNNSSGGSYAPSSNSSSGSSGTAPVRSFPRGGN
ncbi:MAG: hypothetical protein ACO22R_04465 [Chitinophagaceae bacterium]|jgi:hypothetical protein